MATNEFDDSDFAGNVGVYDANITLYRDGQPQVGITGASATAGTAPDITAVRTRGTIASSSATSDGDTLLGIHAYGKASSLDEAAAILFKQNGAVSGANVPGSIMFQTAPDSGALVTRLTLAATGAATFTGTVTATQFFLSALNTAPANAGSTGTAGEVRIDANHVYVCVAANTWKRVAIATW